MSWAPFHGILCTSWHVLVSSGRGGREGMLWWKYWPGRLGIPTADCSLGGKVDLDGKAQARQGKEWEAKSSMEMDHLS